MQIPHSSASALQKHTYVCLTAAARRLEPSARGERAAQSPAEERCPMRKDDPASVVELFRARAQAHPDRDAIVLLDDKGGVAERMTFQDVDAHARSVAALLAQDLSPGDRALLVYLPGREFLAAFLGCLYAGVVAVPVVPPIPGQSPTRLARLAEAAEPARTLTTGALAAYLRAEPSLAAALPPLLATDHEPPAPGAWKPPPLDPESLAFLQFTSGSTSDPKGVLLTHANLLHNLGVIRDGFRVTESTVGVFWLPVYHDMGLIGGVLEPLAAGSTLIQMSPLAFVKKPLLWLQAITAFGGTIAGAPNFAYQLCVDKVPEHERSGLDLSSWEVAFCGAEPVRESTLAAFEKAYAPYGFRAEAWLPVYGMAEATLLVTGARAPGPRKVFVADRASLDVGAPVPSAPGARSAALVGCGQALGGQDLAVVRPDTGEKLPDRTVGEIWLRGPSVAAGYRLPGGAIDAERFTARTDAGDGPYLRTGDLGFLDKDELYVTGRLKDLIIVAGRNVYPQDVEATAEAAHPELRHGCAAAFGVAAEDGERLAVVAEIRRDADPSAADQAVRSLRSAIARAHGSPPALVLVTAPHSVPKTTSGKIRRGEVRRLVLEGRIHALASYTEPGAATAGLGLDDRRSVDEVLAWLCMAVARHVGIPAVDVPVDVGVVEQGLSSLQLAELCGELEEWLARPVDIMHVCDQPDLRNLAAHLADESHPPLVAGGGA
jgi:acyl-CoA synthetase (AMP-forming)/AMP-acid ligase II